MAKKEVREKNILEKIFDYTLEDIMGQRFGSYASRDIHIKPRLQTKPATAQDARFA